MISQNNSPYERRAAYDTYYILNFKIYIIAILQSYSAPNAVAAFFINHL